MKRKKIISCTCILILLLGFSKVTSAYVTTGFKWPGSTYPITVTFKWGDRLTQSSVIKTGYTNAIYGDWNYMQMRIKFSESSSSSNILNSYTVTSSSEYGYNLLYSIGSTYDHFLAFVNAGNSQITQSNVARSVAGHELGHGISLAEGNVANSLMDQGRDRTVTYRPTQDDLDGINTIYK